MHTIDAEWSVELVAEAAMISRALRLPKRTLAHQYAVTRHVAAARRGDTTRVGHISRLCAARLWRVAFALTESVIATELTITAIAEIATGRAPLDDSDDAELVMLRRVCALAAQSVEGSPLAALPDTPRAVFALIQYGGLSYSEAAAVTGTDVAAVRNACAAARTALSASADPCGGPVRHVSAAVERLEVVDA